MLNPMVDITTIEDSSSDIAQLMQKTAKYYSNKYNKTELQQLAKYNDLQYNTKSSKMELLSLLANIHEIIISTT